MTPGRTAVRARSDSAEAAPILVVDGVTKAFRFRDRPFGPRKHLVAVNRISLTVTPGETVAIIGESGCGKSTLGRLMTGEVAPDAGQVRIEGRAVDALTRLEKARTIQPIAQHPKAALNPRWTVARSLGEPLELHRLVPPKERKAAIEQALLRVGLAPGIASSFPRELSGGEAQRVTIARALLVSPRVLVCDEPVSALDAAVQADIVRLLLEIQSSEGTALVFISHDLKLVSRISHRIAIMYLGEIVEIMPAGGLGGVLSHPYTQALFGAAPRLVRHPGKVRRATLAGEVPSPVDRPSGCVFHPRCALAAKVCSRMSPGFESVGSDHLMACHFAGREQPAFGPAEATSSGA